VWILGTIWISDPCTVFDPEHDPLVHSYEEYLHKTGYSYTEQLKDRQTDTSRAEIETRMAENAPLDTEGGLGITCFNYKGGNRGAGISIQTPHGDGLFPVYAKGSAATGEIEEIRIRF
jgi:hypothetical protein